MNLKEFVTESLVEIVMGVSDAQLRLVESGAQISPKVRSVFTNSQTGGTNMALGWDYNGGVIQSVDFDVAVTAIEGADAKGGINVVSGVYGSGTHGKSSDLNQSISRIKFKVPITLPKHSSLDKGREDLND